MVGESDPQVVQPDDRVPERDGQVVPVADVGVNAAQDVGFRPDGIPLDGLDADLPGRPEELGEHAAVVRVGVERAHRDRGGEHALILHDRAGRRSPLAVDADDRSPVPHPCALETGCGDDRVQPGPPAGAPVAVYPVPGVVGGIAGTRQRIDRTETLVPADEQVALVQISVQEDGRGGAALELGDLRERPARLLLRRPSVSERQLEPLPHRLRQRRHPGRRLDVQEA